MTGVRPFRAIAMLCLLPAFTAAGCSSGGILPPKAPATFSSQQTQQLKQTVQEAIQKAGVPGAIVGVWAPDRGTWVEAFGVADAAAKTPLTVNHKVRIGSITKTVTATAVLQLADDGAISLDDNIENYVAKHKLHIPNAKNITIRQLLNHTSGLFNYTDDPALEAVSYANLLLLWTPQELINYGVSHRDYSTPGKEFHYSNTGYALLGLIIEEESKHKVEEEIDRRVIKALGLKNTKFPTGPDMDEPHAHGYLSNEDLLRLSFNLRGNKGTELVDVTSLHPSWAWTGGAMVSDLNDLKVYAKALGTGYLLSKKMQAQRLKTVPMAPGSPTGYGLGIMEVKGFLGHRGRVPGFDTCLLYSPELDATFIVLLTMDPNKVNAEALAINLIKLVYPDKVK